MESLYVIGHKNPDTDSIASAIAYAYLLNATGEKAQAYALGEPSEETAFALRQFGFEAPEVIEKVEEGTRLALVDHNEAQQSVEGREKAKIEKVVDHHRIANFETSDPLMYRAQAVGCTNTILYQMFQEEGIEIPKDLAGLMLSALISDTLLKKSPTCTPKDEQAMDALAELAEIDLNSYGVELLKAGTNLASKSDRELLDSDAKSFPMGDSQVRIGQVNTVDLQEVTERKEGLLKLMEEDCEKENYDLFLLLATDVLKNDSIAFAAGPRQELVDQAFSKSLENNEVLLEGVVSRKKQVVPPLTKAFEK